MCKGILHLVRCFLHQTFYSFYYRSKTWAFLFINPTFVSARIWLSKPIFNVNNNLVFFPFSSLFFLFFFLKEYQFRSTVFDNFDFRNNLIQKVMSKKFHVSRFENKMPREYLNPINLIPNKYGYAYKKLSPSAFPMPSEYPQITTLNRYFRYVRRTITVKLMKIV